jgi:glucan phosphoethanolaminetransferase (alkaline phosphatase superfamily)
MMIRLSMQLLMLMLLLKLAVVSTCNNRVYSNNNRVYPNDFRVPWCRIIFVFLSMLFMTGIFLDFGVK